MSLDDIKKQILKLQNLIKKYNHHYYNLNESLISDYEFDEIFNELQKLEKKYPELVSNNESKKVGAKSNTSFKKHTHRNKMYSLANAFTDEDFFNFHEKNTENDKEVEYVCEVKIDGLAVSLIYDDGVLITGATRGDGFVGENVTNNCKVVKNIPHKLNSNFSGEIRGEVFMTYESFQTLNTQINKQFSNPRNAASGALRQLDYSITKSRNLNFLPYDLISHEKLDQIKKINLMQELGFKTDDNIKLVSKKEDAIEYYKAISDKRKLLKFPVDGVVFKINSYKLQERLGFISRSPKFAIAYKFLAEQAPSVLLDVEYQVGRTGIITPVAKIKTVNIDGVNISSATLHNSEEIKKKSLMLNSKIIVQRAGDVIPEIVRKIESDSANEKEIVFPNVCPSCTTSLVKVDNQVGLYCPNAISCPKQVKESIAHFCSKNGFNIVGLGPSIVEKLLNKGLINSYQDIFTLTFSNLIELDGFKEKSVNNLLRQINISKQIDFNKFIYALGIKEVGTETAKILSKQFSTVQDVSDSNENILQRIDGIGEVVASNIINFFKKNDLSKLLNHINIKYTLNNIKSNHKTYSITGTLEKSRDDIIAMIENSGNLYSKSITKKVNYLISGEKAGSKVEKAKKLNVTILDYQDFLGHIS
jgi:DNA ligase (NAD+)